jgi:hypothetical protein
LNLPFIHFNCAHRIFRGMGRVRTKAPSNGGAFGDAAALLFGGFAMVTKANNRRLFDLLERNITLKSRGYSMAYTGEGGVVVDRAGHVHGIWTFDGDGYKWVSPGSSEPRFRTADAKSAVLFTIVVLGPD